MELFDGLHAIVWGSAFQDSSNAYIIQGEETILIDPGTFKSYTNLFGLMRSAGIDGVDFVLNTHMHRDHCESNIMFMRKGALVGFDERDRDVSPYSYSPDFKIGKCISSGRMEIEVIRTPGHSPGSLTFYIQEFEAAITGDLIFEGGIPGRSDIFGGNRKELLRSLEKIRNLEPSYLLPGHRRVMEGKKGINSMLERAIEIIGLC